MIDNVQDAPHPDSAPRDTRKLEKVLDAVAVAVAGIFLVLAAAGVLSFGSIEWPMGLFTGWLLRHLLH